MDENGAPIGTNILSPVSEAGDVAQHYYAG